jgi:hypothetical protein
MRLKKRYISNFPEDFYLDSLSTIFWDASRPIRIGVYFLGYKKYPKIQA